MRARIARSSTQVSEPWLYDVVEIRQVGAFWYYLITPSSSIPPDATDISVYTDTFRDLIADHPVIANSLIKSTWSVNSTGQVMTDWRNNRPSSGITILVDRVAPIMIAGDDPE